MLIRSRKKAVSSANWNWVRGRTELGSKGELSPLIRKSGQLGIRDFVAQRKSNKKGCKRGRTLNAPQKKKYNQLGFQAIGRIGITVASREGGQEWETKKTSKGGGLLARSQSQPKKSSVKVAQGLKSNIEGMRWKHAWRTPKKSQNKGGVKDMRGGFLRQFSE